MSSILGEIGLTEQLVLSYIIGIAGAPAVQPYVRSLVNAAWESHDVLPPNVYTLATGVAQRQIPLATAQTWAHQQGISTDAFNALVDAANVGPGSAYAFELWRRGLIDKTGFDTAMQRLGIEDNWIPRLEGLHDVLLTSQELAMAQQQGFVDQARADSEGLLQGVTNERQQIRFEMSGLPPGIGEGLQMLRRGIIDQATFAQIVREGHTKTKYTGVLTELERQLLSAATAVRAHLKGHIDVAEMHSRGQDWGYTPADMDLWYLSEGRPATVHEIHIGYARGATVPGAADELDAIATAVKQSDIRPEYTAVLEAGRFSYPSPFVLRSLAQAGDLGNTAAVEQVLLEIGWKPAFARQVSQAWTAPTAAGADSHVGKAQTQLWTATHKAYIDYLITDATATATLPAAGVAAAAIPTVLDTWRAERTLIRRSLSAAQIKKAWFEQTIDPELGRPWTQAEAVTRLQELGYTADDARILLVE